MRAAFRVGRFRLLFLGQFASLLGDSLMLIVLGIWVKDLTDSNGAAGATYFWLALPALISPVVGFGVDKVKRRTLLIWGNVAAAVGMTPLLFVHDEADVWLIYLVGLFYGLSFTALPGALNGMLKLVLPDDLLIDANASLATTKEGLRLIGPLIGAGIYTAVGGAGVAIIDAVSFLVAAVVVVFLRVDEAKPSTVESHWRAEFTAGIRHLWGDALLRNTVLTVSGGLLVVGFMESAVYAMVDAFDKPASFVGVVVSVQGVGAICGGLLSSKIVHKLGESYSIVLGMLCIASGLAIAAIADTLPVLFVGIIVFGFGLPIFIVAFSTLLQVRTPQRLMGRVTSAVDVLFGTPQTISLAVGALLVTLLSYRDIYWICATVIAAAAGYLAFAVRAIPSTAPAVDGVTHGDEAAPETLENKGL